MQKCVMNIKNKLLNTFVALILLITLFSPLITIVNADQNPPTSFNAEPISRFVISLSWINDEENSTYIEWNTAKTWNLGEGILLYNGTDTNYDHINLPMGTQFFYQAWSYNEANNSFSSNYKEADTTTFSNQLPTQSSENPSNNSVDVPIAKPMVSILINDAEGDSLNWTIQGEYILDASSNGDSNGTKSTSLLTPLPYETEVIWYVNATDGFGWTNEIYSFATRSQAVPNAPTSFSATKYNRTQIDLAWTKGDKSDSTYVEWNSIDSWSRGEGTFLYNGPASSVPHDNLNFNTQYFYQAWSFNNTDGTWSVISSSANATTDPNNSPTITGENPADTSTGLYPYPNLNVIVDDSDNDLLDVFWYSNSSGSWLLFAKDLDVNTQGGPISLEHMNANFSQYSKSYWWRVCCFDATVWTNETYSFTTKDQYVPNPPSDLIATTYSANQINLTWTKGDKADFTRIQRRTDGFPTSISDGTNVYNDTGSSWEDFIGIAEGTTYYYSAWSYNVSDDAWSLSYVTAFNKSNSKPVISNPVPVSGSSGVGVLPQLNITVIDVDGDLMTISWYSNSSGSWQLFGTNTSVSNGTAHQINANFSQYGTRYWWYVVVSDGKDTKTSNTFYFTINNKPTVSNPVPANGSISIGPIPQISITVDDLDLNLLTINWYSNSSGSWILFGRNIMVVKGTYQKLNANFSEYGKTYWWYVSVDDGRDITYSGIYHFTVRDQYVPVSPSSFTATKYDRTQINLSWIAGDKSDSTYVEWNTHASWSRGEGTFLYNGTGTAITHDGLNFNTQYFYQAWSFNDTDDTWSTTYSSDDATTDPNIVPAITGEYPADTSTGLNPIPLLSVTVDDSDEDSLDVFWYSNVSGSWNLFAQDLDVDISLGPVSLDQTNANFNDYLTTYWWSVHCFDGTDWTNDTYFFTTRDEYVPSQPGNFIASTYSSNQIDLSWDKGSKADYTKIQRKTDGYPTSISDGLNVYDSTGTSFGDFVGIFEGVTYYYSAWSYNVTDDVWSLSYSMASNASNSKPVISNPVPTSGSKGVGVLPQLNITVNDVDGDLMAINWYSNSSGSWQLFGTNTSVSNGTAHQINANFSQYGTRYWWYVVVSDGKDTKTSNTFYFTINNKPTVSNPVPANGSTNLNPIPQISITVDDLDLDLLAIKWYSNSSGSWVLFGSNNNVIKGTYSKTNTNFSQYGMTYWWYVTVDDETDVITSGVYHFTIRDQYVPVSPSSFTATKYNRTQINLSWIAGDKSDSTYIEWNSQGSWLKGQGAFLYNGTGTAITHDGLNFNTQYFYQAWSWNETDDTWSAAYSSDDATTDPNTAATITDEYPADNSLNVLSNPNLQVTVDDSDEDVLDVFWYSNSSGSWLLFATDLDVNTQGGPVSLEQTNANFSQYSTKYWWQVCCFDGTDWTNETYDFTRSPNNPPLFTNPYPANGSTDLDPTPVCNVTVDDVNEDMMTVYIYENTSRVSDTLSYQIILDEDDAWYMNGPFNDRWVILNYYYYPQKTMAGLRFRNIQIPQGATITSAHISTHYYDSTLGNNADCRIYGDDVDNSQVIVGGTSLINRSLTTANVTWQQVNLGTSWADSPDLSDVIQEVIDRSGWSIGNNISIITEDLPSDKKYGICDYKYSDHSKGAKLYITYVTDVSIWELKQTFTNVAPNTNIIWDKFQKASQFDTTYWWSVNATDNVSWKNETYHFTTREKYIPTKPSSFTATSISSNQINLAWNKDTKADYTKIQRRTDSYPISKDDGTNVYYDTASSYDDFIGIFEGTTYYYSAWSYNVTDDAWSLSYVTAFNTSNSKPMISNPVPVTGSNGVGVLPQLNITVNDSNGDLMTISWYSNSSGSWQLFGTNSSVANGIYHQINSNFSQYSKIYWWFVTVNDGKDTNNSATFYFTINFMPTISNPYPANASTGIILTPQMNISVVDLDSDFMNINWYSNSSGTWELFATNTHVGNGVYHKTNTNFSSLNTTYFWYVNVSDGKSTNTSSIFYFTTNDKPRITSSIPENGSIGNIIKPLMNLTIEDTEGDLMTINWFSNSSGTWQLFGTNTSVANGTYHQINTNFKRYNTTYFWYVTVSDGKNTNISDFYHFTTMLNTAPLVYGEGPVNDSENIKTVPILNVTVDDPDKDLMNVFWYSNSSGSWKLFATNTGIDPKDNPVNISQVNSNFTKYNTSYWWSVNVTDTTDWVNQTYKFTTKENILPVVNNENPINGSEGSKIIPALNVTVNDIDNDMLDVYWYSNSTGSWEPFGTNLQINTTNGEVNISKINTNFTKYNTTYWWNVSCFDGTDWVNNTYKFTTKVNDIPIISNEKPINGSINVSVTPQLNVEVYDPDGDPLDISWYSISDGNWNLFGTNLSVNTSLSPVNISQINSNFSKYNTSYWWSINVTDGTDWVNDFYYFTTKINTAPNVITTVPLDGKTGVYIPLNNISINVSDFDGDLINITLKTNASGNWITFNNLSNIVNGTYTFTNTSWTSQYGTKYWWSANVTDGTNWTNTSFGFTSNFKPTISFENPSNASILDLQPICNVTVSDEDEDIVDVYFYENSTTIYSSINSKIISDVDDAYYLGGMRNSDILIKINEFGFVPLLAGLRFRDVQIPQGATITNATLNVHVFSGSVDNPDVTIYGHYVDNSPVIEGSTGQNELINRTLTTSSVHWINQDVGSGPETSPDISCIIQEIINRPGWKRGNNITIITNDVQSAKQFWINDFQLDPLNSFTELNVSFSVSPLVLQQTNYGVSSNSSVIWNKYTNASSFDTKYWWSVHVNDGCSWTNETYHFTTRSAFISDPPLSLTAAATERNIINLTWVNNENNTYIEYNTVESWAVGQGNPLINTNSIEVYTHQDLEANIIYYYQAWGYNTTDDSYSLNYLSANATSYGNTKPAFSNKTPENNTINVDINYAQVSIDINDLNGDTFNWTIQGQYIVDNNGLNNDFNGTKTAVLITPLPFDTEIVWYVNATDGYSSRNETYNFTTRAQYIPAAPASLTANPVNRTQIDLSWGSDGNNYTYVEWFTSENWALGYGYFIDNSSINTSFVHTDLNHGTQYFYQAWTYNQTDNVFSTANTSADAITAINHAPLYSSPNPNNGTLGHEFDLNWTISITDADGDLFDWRIECNNSDNNSFNNDINGSKKLELNGLARDTLYTIWVNSTDGYNWTKEWFTFRTKSGYEPPVPTSFVASTINRTQINLSWGSEGNNYTYVEWFTSENWAIGNGYFLDNSSTNTSIFHSGLDFGTKYYYQAWAYNKTWNKYSNYVKANATTIANSKPLFGAPSPANGAVDQPLSLTWSILITDNNMDTFNWTIECININSKSMNNDTNGTKQITLNNLQYYTLYTIWVSATDGYEWNNASYSFRTKSDDTPFPPPPVPPPNDPPIPPITDITPPTKPTNVKCTTSESNNLPQFSWSASTDSSGIKGYYVKIGNNNEISVGKTLSWTSTTAVEDGTHTFYVRAEDNNLNKGNYASCIFTITTSSSGTRPVANPGGPYYGLTYQTIQFDGSRSYDLDGSIVSGVWDFGNGSTATGTKPTHIFSEAGQFNVSLTVTDNDGLTNTDVTTAIIWLDTDKDGYSDELEESYFTDINDSKSFPLDTDGDGIPDLPSQDKKYAGDYDDDNDGLRDDYEKSIGSDPKNNTDVISININGSIYFLVDINKDGKKDLFYNDVNQTSTPLGYGENKYYIDMDYDGKWDMTYNILTQNVSSYVPEESQLNGQGALNIWTYAIFISIAIIAFIILMVLYLFKIGYLYFKYIIVEDKKSKNKKKK